MTKELYKKYRPKSLKRVLGNKGTVESLKRMLERETLPHTILFYGPSGCGKTTLARILKRELECSDMDFKEMNCSDLSGKDAVRDIAHRLYLSPTGGDCRIWLLDEVHRLTPDAQNAALKMLEDTPDHVYFFLCTTEPEKLKKAIHTRCCKMPVEPLPRDKMKKLLRIVSKREKIRLTEELLEDIVDASEGSARTCLVILDKLANLPEGQRGEAIASALEEPEEVIELCRALIKRMPWKTVSKILRGIQTEPESVRWAVLGYAKAVLLKTADSQAYHVISCFENHFYDSKQAGLVAASFESVHGEV